MRSFESREDYLETILVLKREKGAVRSIDVATRMGFSKPSVSRAVSLLKAADLLTMDKDGLLELTPSGLAMASRVYERHCLIKTYLEAIGVSKETAAEDACRIEHVISEESVEKLKEFMRSHGVHG